MPVLESLEQRGLFRLTRLVAFLIVSILTLGLVVGGILFFKDFMPNEESHVSYTKLVHEIHPKSNSDEPQNPQEPVPHVSEDDTLTMPFEIQPYFSDTQNRTVLKNHMSGLDSAERTDYLDNMAEVVREAKSHNEDVTEVINRYFEDKATQMELAKLDRASRLQRQIYVAGSAVSLVLLISFASLILVLLAIERNTRPRLRDA
jgi:hypothetical protein